MTEQEYEKQFKELEARCNIEKTSLGRAMALASFLAFQYMKSRKVTVREAKLELLEAARIRNNGNMSAVARDLGVDRRTIYRWK